MADYDIVTVGGGVGGAAIAKAMAERGYRVLVVEREKQFKDCVRGEWMAPWGVAEAKELGVYEALMAAGGHHTPKMQARAGPAAMPVRDLISQSALQTAASRSTTRRCRRRCSPPRRRQAQKCAEASAYATSARAASRPSRSRQTAGRRL